MSQACGPASGTVCHESGSVAARGVADWLYLAATPAFAIMALLTGAMGKDQSALICSATSGPSPLTGMVTMYWLMAIFHAVPWLELISDCCKRKMG